MSNHTRDNNNAFIVSNTLDKLKTAQETIDKRIDYLQLNIDMQMRLAKSKHKDGKKVEAIACLKRKKMFETNVDNLRGMHFTLEQQINTIETMQLNTFSFGALSSSSTLLKSMTSKMDIDTVDETMDEMKDRFDMVDEIGNVLCKDYTGSNIDESQLETELDDLLAEDADLIAEEKVREVSKLHVPYEALKTSSKNTDHHSHGLATHPQSIDDDKHGEINKSLEEFGSQFF